MFSPYRVVNIGSLGCNKIANDVLRDEVQKP